ncbi:PhzF family phenazine biosynthesis protein [Aestuariibius sp. 2305UL40-4]|uniref:PhzF family phenazine biosynthesis protein n=1 Tax=Aestuariibius violaceus TaxID=3234132 RepID=UPI00345E26B4
MRLPYHVWDVFTDTPFAGNPLAIVEDAGDLTTAQMQTLAAEFNLSETIFVMPARDAAHTARVRIFFPTAEIPFAGHPTVGCALFLAEKLGLTEITLEEEAGLVPVTIADGKAEFTAPILPAATGAQADPALIAAALDLPPKAIGPHQPGVLTGGPSFVFIPLTDLDALAKARPIEPHWSKLMDECGVDAGYLYTPGTECDYRTRMFSPTAGIPEDPATGSAAAILQAHLLANAALPDGETSLHILQGVEMGRPSHIHATAAVTNGQLTSVRIAGQAVPISSGNVTVPGV